MIFPGLAFKSVKGTTSSENLTFMMPPERFANTERNFEDPYKWAFHRSFYSPYSKGLQALLPHRIGAENGILLL
jgi:hypothetical protein